MKIDFKSPTVGTTYYAIYVNTGGASKPLFYTCKKLRDVEFEELRKKYGDNYVYRAKVQLQWSEEDAKALNKQDYIKEVTEGKK